MGQHISTEISNALNSEAADKAREAVEDVMESVEFTLSDLPGLVQTFLRSTSNGNGIDDRKLLLEKSLTFMAKHGNSSVSRSLEGKIVDILYKDLPHPPSSYLSATHPSEMSATHERYKGVTYAYRPADGSNYNPANPSFGKAGTAYARTVPSTHPLPPHFLPDPGLLFDTLLKRDEFVPHPGGVSSLFFAFADLVIHSIFNTNHRNWTINDTSSYLDLSILYGNSEKDLDRVRRKDGTGRLWDDVFADSRLLFMPPSACALLVLLSRNHNFIADRIRQIDENGTYRSPETLSETERLAQDDEIFQRTRLVNCGYFMQIILGDYVGAILGLVRDGYSWRLKILEPIRELNHNMSPRGEGNAISVEFNLMYRWHSTLSLQDSQWTESMLNGVFEGKDLSKITPQDFISAAHKAMRPPSDVREWVFGGLERNTDGKFSNADLARILQNATEASASAFKARGVPEALRVIEIMGIEQARSWGTCSLNEFRKFMGLKPYDSFAEWNPDPSIHKVAESLYHDIDNLELYVGMQAEEAKKPSPGAGLCPGYTVSRAILADAVCLTRGDRFLTVDFTPQNLTSWGYQDCQLDPTDGSFGGMLTKLLLRTLPEFYPVGSAYAHFPFMVPEKMRDSIASQPNSQIDKYTWSRPEKNPAPEYLLGDVACEERLREVVGSSGFDHSLVENVIIASPHLTQTAEFLEDITKKLLSEGDIDQVGSNLRYIDIVKKVFKILPVRWLGGELKKVNMDDLLDIAQYIYINDAPEHAFSLRSKAVKGGQSFIKSITRLFENYAANPPTESENLALLPALYIAGMKQGADQATLVTSVVANILPTISLYSKVLTLVINELLDVSVTEWTEAAILSALSNAVQSLGGHRPNHGLVHDAFLNATVPHIVDVIRNLKNISRAPGVSGRLSKYPDSSLYLNDKGQITPWPISMVVQFAGVV